ncbi:MAG: nitroreductase [Verrucomicrobiota bacterium]|nr:nitroreductase [Verrucomicrobiota bacterium]
MISKTFPITEIIRNRRTVKPAMMDPDLEIPIELVDELLENANWAPTHGFTEPWRFVIFSEGYRKVLGEKLQELYSKHTPDDQFRQDKIDKLGKNPILAPIVMAICMKRGDNPKIPELEEIEAVACAVQNMHLTAAAAGLGAFWSSPPILDTEGMREFLSLRESDRCLGLFYIGLLKEGENWPKSSRGPISDKISWFGKS